MDAGGWVPSQPTPGAEQETRLLGRGADLIVLQTLFGVATPWEDGPGGFFQAQLLSEAWLD